MWIEPRPSLRIANSRADNIYNRDRGRNLTRLSKTFKNHSCGLVRGTEPNCHFKSVEAGFPPIFHKEIYSNIPHTGLVEKSAVQSSENNSSTELNIRGLPITAYRKAAVVPRKKSKHCTCTTPKKRNFLDKYKKPHLSSNKTNIILLPGTDPKIRLTTPTPPQSERGSCSDLCSANSPPVLQRTDVVHRRMGSNDSGYSKSIEQLDSCDLGDIEDNFIKPMMQKATDCQEPSHRKASTRSCPLYINKLQGQYAEKVKFEKFLREEFKYITILTVIEAARGFVITLLEEDEQFLRAKLPGAIPGGCSVHRLSTTDGVNTYYLILKPVPEDVPVTDILKDLLSKGIPVKKIKRISNKVTKVKTRVLVVTLESTQYKLLQILETGIIWIGQNKVHAFLLYPDSGPSNHPLPDQGSTDSSTPSLDESMGSDPCLFATVSQLSLTQQTRSHTVHTMKEPIHTKYPVYIKNPRTNNPVSVHNKSSVYHKQPVITIDPPAKPKRQHISLPGPSTDQWPNPEENRAQYQPQRSNVFSIVDTILQASLTDNIHVQHTDKPCHSSSSADQPVIVPQKRIVTYHEPLMRSQNHQLSQSNQKRSQQRRTNNQNSYNHPNQYESAQVHNQSRNYNTQQNNSRLNNKQREPRTVSPSDAISKLLGFIDPLEDTVLAQQQQDTVGSLQDQRNDTDGPLSKKELRNLKKFKQVCPVNTDMSHLVENNEGSYFCRLQGIQELMSKRPLSIQTINNLTKIEKENKTRDSNEPAPPARNKECDTPTAEVHADEKTISILKMLNPKLVLDRRKKPEEEDSKVFKTDTFGFTDIIKPDMSTACTAITEQHLSDQTAIVLKNMFGHALKNRKKCVTLNERGGPAGNGDFIANKNATTKSDSITRERRHSIAMVRSQENDNFINSTSSNHSSVGSEVTQEVYSVPNDKTQTMSRRSSCSQIIVTSSRKPSRTSVLMCGDKSPDGNLIDDSSDSLSKSRLTEKGNVVMSAVGQAICDKLKQEETRKSAGSARDKFLRSLSISDEYDEAIEEDDYDLDYVQTNPSDRNTQQMLLDQQENNYKQSQNHLSNLFDCLTGTGDLNQTIGVSYSNNHDELRTVGTERERLSPRRSSTNTNIDDRRQRVMSIHDQFSGDVANADQSVIKSIMNSFLEENILQNMGNTLGSIDESRFS